ncbi:hypothetical protein Ddye_008601 [Dipteronia dyeriana]|uniref:DNA annealing helicase and endonuclease ZRANB3 n=1 Tax=Dipteronia dyeriana TaxID=168575 RepID=A0AAD9X9W3_9ROSI|nr:hypothetical protein Ddye_008601 [Dipteronia dyeriana]
MEMTEEQRQRAEANRLAAIAKRKAKQQINQKPWKLFKCRKLSVEPTKPHAPPLPDKFRVRLEICSPDSFSVSPLWLKGFAYPGEDECLRSLSLSLSHVMPSHYTQNYSGKACVYKLTDYNAVLTCLKNSNVIEVEGIPWVTLNVVEKLSHSLVTGRWSPSRPEHLSDEIVDEMIGKLPKRLSDVLLPFQLEGIRFAMRRGGRCLIADEMGLGKTLQAIAIAGCFMHEGSILLVCPAILRFSWAEELERWLPCCLPADIHLVFGHQNNPANLTRFPKVVVISYTMLHHLRNSMMKREWALLIIDESHHVRCSKKKSEPGEVTAILDMAAKIKRIILLSGTPSFSRPYDIFHQINMLWPGLLGKNKYDFAKTYCDVKVVQGYQGQNFQDFSRGVRLEELNVLLKQSVMIRRLKENVLVELPPKRRQIIKLSLKRSDIVLAKASVLVKHGSSSETNATKDTSLGNLDEPDDSGAPCRLGKLSYQELGIAKLSGFCEWLSIHPFIAESDGAAELDLTPRSSKMLIFAHHHKVLDGIQEFICQKGIPFVRIDGNTLPRDRQSAVQSFQSSNEVKVAIIGITAGGVGLDFSSAQNVVFLELPQSPSLMLQAEDRAHRRGQTSAVNIYIFCAKETIDESHWQNLNRRLRCVSSTTNGKYDALQEIAVEGVSYLEMSGTTNRGCENLNLYQVASGNLSEESFPGYRITVDKQSIHSDDEVTANLNDKSVEPSKTDGSSTETDDLHNKDMVPDLEIDEDYVSMGKAEDKTLSGAETGIHETVSSELDRGKNEMDQSEKENKSHPQTTEIDADENCSDQVNYLRFEVSQYTGRIHLYSCIPGIDLRPKPLYENFRSEDLELQHSPAAFDNKERTSESLKDNPAYRDAILAFVSEWNKLRPIERSKLLGKPLQLPLSVELCYLKETINHSSEGLLKGGSKRRSTPSFEISHPLPSNAVWKKVLICSGSKKKEKEYSQAWTLTDEPLCKLCQTPCKGNNAKTPEYFEDLFCNLECYEEYRIRTSGRYLRQELFQIEHGVCTSCQLDCHKLVKHIKPLSLERRRKYIEEVAPKVASRKNFLEKLVNDPTEGNAWHADHIIPVYRGGGECRLENMRTLCVACHYEVTVAQCAERRSTRLKAMKQLKVIMKGLRNDQNVNRIGAHIEDQGQEMQENIVEEELFVKVPGSSYTEGQAEVLSLKT